MRIQTLTVRESDRELHAALHRFGLAPHSDSTGMWWALIWEPERGLYLEGENWNGRTSWRTEHDLPLHTELRKRIDLGAARWWRLRIVIEADVLRYEIEP